MKGVQVWTCKENVKGEKPGGGCRRAGEACSIRVAARRLSVGLYGKKKKGKKKERGNRFRVSDLLLLTRCDALPPERIIKSSC